MMKKIRMGKVVLYGTMIVLFILRVLLGEKLGFYFISAAGADDALMFYYAKLSEHFTQPNSYSMVKDMSYPLLLNISARLNISYPLLIAILWLAAALCVYLILKVLLKKDFIAWLAYTYILYHPSAFDSNIGTRLYRNAIIAPCVMILFSLLILMMYEMFRPKRNKFIITLECILFSLIFLYTYYIKEDGLWILACVLFFFGAAFIGCVIGLMRSRKEKKNRSIYVQNIVCLMVPLLIFGAGTEFYKKINGKYFGVEEIQTRTEGELGQFVSYVYQVDSSEQTCIYTAPADSIKKVFEVSETLQQYPELLDSILHSSWYDYDIESNPIKGDFLTWVLRTALTDTGIWQSERQVSDLFKQANDEIEEAFATGKLQKSQKIQLLSSAVGRTPEEIREIFPYIVENFIDVITLKGYNADLSGMGECSADPSISQTAAGFTKLNYLSDYSLKDEDSEQSAINFSNGLIVLYRIWNVILVILTVLFLILFLICFWKKHRSIKLRKNLYISLISLVILGIMIAYSFSITWFAQFLMEDITQAWSVFNFYTTPLIALFTLVTFLTIGNGMDTIGKATYNNEFQ